MRPILRKEYKAVLKQLKVTRTVEELASKLSWDRLRILLMLNELIKTGLAERTDADQYKLTDKGKKTLEGIEAAELLAELPAAFQPNWEEEWKRGWSWKGAWPSVYERVPFGKRHRRGR